MEENKTVKNKNQKLKPIVFIGKKCTVDFCQYENGRTAVRLLDNKKRPVCVATVNIPEIELPGSEYVLIKNFSENQGVLQLLKAAKYIQIIKPVQIRGFVDNKVWLCKLLVVPKFKSEK
jgi:hypothetical protein